MIAASRVRALSPAGEFVFSIRADKAQQLIAEGTAVQLGKGKLKAVTLLRAAAPEQQTSCREATIRSYLGWSPTFREALKNPAGKIDAYTITLKHIAEQDEPIFRAALWDCLIGPGGERYSGESIAAALRYAAL